MRTKLRPYQEEIKSKVYEAWQNGARNVMLVMPTGAGKTRTFCSITIDKAFGIERLPTAIMVHRKELVQQISLTLAEEGILHNIIAPQPVIKGIISAQRRVLNKAFYDYKANVTVLSVDTLNSRIQKHENWARGIRLFIVDEAAHVLKENKWGQATNYFQNAIGLGVTATPQRLDKRGLGSHVDGIFDAMVEGPTSKWLIDQGFLSKYKVAVPQSDYEMYLKKAHDGSDYTRSAMAEASAQSAIVGDVVANYQKWVNGKQAIVFASDIESAGKMEKRFRDSGITAKLLTGETADKERLDSLIEYREKKIAVLINVDLFDEGLDVPGIESVIMARPTMSLGKYLQMCLDQETEILTDKGWCKYTELDQIETVAAFNTENHHIEWCQVEEKIIRKRELNEKMFSFHSTNLDFRVTSQHDMIVKSRKSKNWRKQAIDEVAQRLESFHVPVSAASSQCDCDLSDSEIKFLGWFLTDGSMTMRGPGQTVAKIYQCSNQTEHLNHIESTLIDCNFKFGKTEIKRTGELAKYDSMIMFTIPLDKPKRNFKGWDNKRSCRDLLPWMNKSIPKLYWTMSDRQIDLLLKVMEMGDGTKKKTVNWTSRTMDITCGDNEEMADNLQALLIARGYRCNKSVEKRSHINRKDLFYLRIKKVLTSSISGLNCPDGVIDGKSYERSRIQIEADYKNEMVWCVKNRLGTLVTRRNGRVLIMGNCGRGLRPSHNKPYTVIIDHVGNVRRHGLPCEVRKWTLDRIVKRRDRVNLVRICANPMCNAPYDRALTECPYCGTLAVAQSRAGGESTGRASIKEIDGDLALLDPDTLREMEKDAVLEDPGALAERVARAAGAAAGLRAAKLQRERIETQKRLAEVIAKWAGYQKRSGYSDRSIHKKFFLEFDMTITYALGQPRAEMDDMIEDLGSRGFR